MESLMIYNETNIYILSKLVSLVRRETGRRHRLNNQTAITALITDAAASRDERTQNYFRRFLENLTPEQLVSFEEHGVDIPKDLARKPSLIPTGPARQFAYTQVKSG